MMPGRKFLVALLCALFLIGGLALIQGCGGGGQTEQTQTVTQEEPAITEEPKTAEEPKSEESMPAHEEGEAMMTLAGYACPMHPEEASLEPGTCGVCGMNLEPAKLYYVCTMHPEETSLEPGKCSVCGMDLVLRPAAREGEQGSMQ